MGSSSSCISPPPKIIPTPPPQTNQNQQQQQNCQPTPKPCPLKTLNAQGLSDYITSPECKNIVVLTGSTISLAAGVPDFKMLQSDIYSRIAANPHLESNDYDNNDDENENDGNADGDGGSNGDSSNAAKQNMLHNLFDLSTFLTSPCAFYAFAKYLYTDEKCRPSLSHHFIRLLGREGKLRRVYTQNIDGLHHRAGDHGATNASAAAGSDGAAGASAGDGKSGEFETDKSGKIVEVHGTTRTASCTSCGLPADANVVRNKIKLGIKPTCNHCPNSNSEDNLLKPDIVFIGESMSPTLQTQIDQGLPDLDEGNCDLLLVIGASCIVQPFRSFVDKVSPSVPRVFINLDGSVTGARGEYEDDANAGHLGQINTSENTRDLLLTASSIDDVCGNLSKIMKWDVSLRSLIENYDITNKLNGTGECMIPTGKENRSVGVFESRDNRKMDELKRRGFKSLAAVSNALLEGVVDEEDVRKSKESFEGDFVRDADVGLANANADIANADNKSGNARSKTTVASRAPPVIDKASFLVFDKLIAAKRPRSERSSSSKRLLLGRGAETLFNIDSEDQTISPSPANGTTTDAGTGTTTGTDVHPQISPSNSSTNARTHRRTAPITEEEKMTSMRLFGFGIGVVEKSNSKLPSEGGNKYESIC